MRYLLMLLLLSGCSALAAPQTPDAGADTWDGHCTGPKDNGRRAVWMHTVYVCRDNGPPNHWYFVQDPEFYGVRVP